MEATSTFQVSQQYIEILEKTNQQLSLWYNPYGLLVAIVTLLVAILAIMFAYILYRQGREYQEAFQAFLNEQKILAEGELKKSILEAKNILDKQIETQQKSLKDLKGKAREDIEKEILNLQKSKDSLEKEPFVISSLTSSPSVITKALSYNVATQPRSSVLSFGRVFKNICPKCSSLIENAGSLYCSNCGAKL